MEEDIIEEMMKQEILIIRDKQKKIEELIEKEIISEDVFNFIFSTNNICLREQFIIKLQERAKKLGLKPNFDKILKKYEREENRNSKIIETNQTHNEVAEILFKNENIVLYENDLYIYENGVYTRDKKTIERKIMKIIAEATSHFREEVYKDLLLMANEVKINRESNIINLKNGLLNIKTGILQEHTSNFFSINQINTNYNPNAKKVQAIDDVLDKLSNGMVERKQTLLEMIGYCMTTSVKLQKAFILYGNTAQNGKSTLLDIITTMLGTENVGTVPFKEISQNKFAGSGIKDKILNSGKEMTDEYIIDISSFKMFVTGDELEIEEKFKARQKIKPFAKFIFSANELPKVADKTNGFYRRLHIIPLEYSFTNKDRKTFNFDKLVNEQAREYLAKISIQAYMDMGDNFANFKESEKEINKYKIEANNVLSFINDEDYIMPFIETATSTKYASEVYGHYKNYCAENQWRPIGMQKFYREIEKSELICYIGKHNNQKMYTLNKDFYKKQQMS